MLKQIFSTDQSAVALVARLTLALVILPHGFQQAFGWFGGYGFKGTMQYYTVTEKLPYVVALLVILLQTLGAAALLLGIATRPLAFAMLVLFLGMIIKSHWNHGFFMNWGGGQKGEGFEYHLLVLGLCTILLLEGGGLYSLDATIKKYGA